MAIEITPLGGMGEVGKNMTVLRFDDVRVVVDMGIMLENILRLGNVSIEKMNRRRLIDIGGIPDDTQLRGKDVSAIVLSHGHLDHVGAIGKLASAYDAPVYATPFTMEVVKHLIREERVFDVSSDLKTVELGDKVEVDGVEIEFIRGTHSIPHTAHPAVGNSEGTVLCASGVKLDDDPLLGDAPDYDSLRRLSDGTTLINLVCAVRVDESGSTPSEAYARQMLKEVMTEAAERKKGLLITAFSTHIARIKSIVDISHELGREPVILGRSLRRNCDIASKLGLVEFPSDLRIHGRSGSVENVLYEVDNSKEDYVVLCTGHQGEPRSILTRIADGRFPYKVGRNDEVVFSASVIPNPLNIANRNLLETKLEAEGAKIHRDVHVSGHASREGIEKFIRLTNPDHLVPFHGTFDNMEKMINLGRDLGYPNKRLHLLKNGQSKTLNA
ncbi:hypothetical protein AKJ43_02720 [candidate division MSBL1 archaeon SCGC-AAA261D19]|uniref:Metallo-beta-lactamase domain-containing protein n=1 Tax=candidate division MSBL1 archaeon SCGC-AAA261D19 TaxID=1698273 RepID=A0A133V6C4_9EURY|nr:hypothetical protein AKJ43_02720 [candidate division MSBL1 archaeon SCGC-AAA261D19]